MPGEKHVFTDEEIEYILDNWGKLSANSIRNKIGCSWASVCKIAKEHGLELPKSNNWTEEEINKLKELADKYNYKDIAKLLNKSEKSVYFKARNLNIELIKDSKVWTKEEEDLLAELWGTRILDTLAKKFNRTPRAIVVKAEKMGLGPMIKNNGDLMTVRDIMDLLNVSYERITRTWVKYGLNLKKKKVTKHKFYYAINLDELILFLKNNQNLWNSKYLEKNILGIEPDWLKEKRKKDYLEEKEEYRRWTDEEIKLAVELFKIKKSYKEIAARLNRSEVSVATIIRNQGYSYRLPKYWTGKELKYLKDNYENMSYKEIAQELGRTTRATETKALELGYKKRLIKKKED